MPFFRSVHSETDPTAPATATISRVQLDAPNRYLNTLSIKPTFPSTSAPPPTVLLHGYGAGLGFFFHNFPPLANWAANRGASVYAVDWLGMGRSARVPFTVKAKKDDIPARVAEAESFFIDALEEWRTKMGLKSMTIVGHSLGAYLSVAYALKYPERVHKLILLSPAGVPHNPDTEEPERELRDNEAEIQHSRPPALKEQSTFQRATDRRAEKVNPSPERKPAESRSRRLFHYLWEEGWSPFQVLRSTVFWGPLLIGKVSSLISYLSKPKS
jgi:cardiolipin-specific phospholipase